MIDHARQSSRKNRLLDTFERAVHMSDPLISMVYIEDRIKAEVSKNLQENLIEQFLK